MPPRSCCPTVASSPAAAILAASVELFSPPYLFQGARPTISAAPASVGYGQTFFVGTPDAGDHHEGDLDTALFRDTHEQHEPADQPFELLAGRGRSERHGTVEQQPGAARTLHAVRPERRRRALGARMVRLVYVAPTNTPTPLHRDSDAHPHADTLADSHGDAPADSDPDSHGMPRRLQRRPPRRLRRGCPRRLPRPLRRRLPREFRSRLPRQLTAIPRRLPRRLPP